MPESKTHVLGTGDKGLDMQAANGTRPIAKSGKSGYPVGRGLSNAACMYSGQATSA